MKDKLFGIILLLVASLLLTGCTTKEVISAEDFKSVTEEYGYTVQDDTESYQMQTSFEKVLIATKKDDIYQIEYALMEANGQVSFLPKKDYANITLKDMNLKKENDGLVANIIIDSKINEDNLKNVKKTKEWVDRELKLKGYDSYENILLATLDKNDKFIIYEKNENKNTTDVLN